MSGLHEESPRSGRQWRATQTGTQPRTVEDYLRITCYLLTIGSLLATPIAAATNWIGQVDSNTVGKVQLWMSAALGAFSIVVLMRAGFTNMKIVLLPAVVLATSGVLWIRFVG